MKGLLIRIVLVLAVTAGAITGMALVFSSEISHLSQQVTQLQSQVRSADVQAAAAVQQAQSDGTEVSVLNVKLSQLMPLQKYTSFVCTNPDVMFNGKVVSATYPCAG